MPAASRPKRAEPRDTPTPVDDWAPEQWVDEGSLRAAAKGAVGRGEHAEQRRPLPIGLPEDVRQELVRATGPKRAERLEGRLDDARRAFERERYMDARRMVAKLAVEAPGAAAVRELHGLCLYRLERWRQAASEFEAFRTITGSYDQHPVLADCYRAMKRYDTVTALWDELRQASPSAELMAEGRIVAAGALADQGDLRRAIELLERAPAAKRLRFHHLRQWYALADLYDRAGDVPRARQLFGRIEHEDSEFADVGVRLRFLGR